MSQSILILSPDFVTERMAGPAIRYWEFAKALAPNHAVTLATPNTIPEGLQQTVPYSMVQHTEENIDELVNRHDIILFQGYILDRYPLLRQTDKILVADLYDPIPLEGLERHKDQHPDEASPIIADQIRMMTDQLKLADYFLCASPRQRDLWLGYLMAVGRINPLTYDEIQQRVITVPFGFPDVTPQRTGTGFRQSLDKEAGFVLLWGGGIWEWFDPLTLIRAIHRLLPRYPNLRLVFLGTQHPNPSIPTMPMQHRAESLARELNLYNTHVIFQSGWVPYDTLHNHLLDADVGVSAHFETLETHFSFRTRILYYLWAEKPIITTEGDVLADEIAQNHAGIVVNPTDEDAWIAAIEKMHDPKHYAAYVEGVKTLAQHYCWSKVTHSLQTLCTNASRSPDMPIENGYRKSNQQNYEQENNLLKSQLVELEQQLEIIENSNSWRITAPMRTLRRQLTHRKTS
ncbi:glycosyltransferase family 4 protein [Candidatus Parabeggiatoa sp. HSG14]|uniref:glycosyltransferase family 4 protein n=1 Tax=Candidatus Parabeggiatoa sp. HSG14 TaxID=3055593 RepID=UPI0025A77EB8|nr:glycosyltransferase family 4 protein [Thiotrichales bacterium HSG14]